MRYPTAIAHYGIKGIQHSNNTQVNDLNYKPHSGTSLTSTTPSSSNKTKSGSQRLSKTATKQKRKAYAAIEALVGGKNIVSKTRSAATKNKQ